VEGREGEILNKCFKIKNMKFGGKMKISSKEKLLWISICLTIFSIFLVSYPSNEFGGPMRWVSYKGHEEIQSAWSFFTPAIFTQTHFHMLYFFINVFLIYMLLTYSKKIFIYIKSKN